MNATSELTETPQVCRAVLYWASCAPRLISTRHLCVICQRNSATVDRTRLSSRTHRQTIRQISGRDSCLSGTDESNTVMRSEKIGCK